MPGKKDFVSVKIDGKRMHVQKHLVLSNLREVYHEFKENFSDRKIAFSMFAELRPKHCILAGASGTHSVCVCTIHQNVKLTMCVIQLSDLPTYHHCLARIMCNPALPKCLQELQRITTLKNNLFFLMVQHLSKNRKNFSICAITEMIGHFS